MQQLEQEVCSKTESEKPGIRLTSAQVEYATAMLDKYGNDYKVSFYIIVNLLRVVEESRMVIPLG